MQNWVRNHARLQQHGGLEPDVVRFFRITPRARLPSQPHVCLASRRCRLLELCQLDPFVAPSYGAQHAVAANIEKAVQQFGKEERARLAKANVTLRYHALHRRNVSSTDLFGCDRRPSILPIRHQARDARKGIGQDYRPFDPKTGASRQATEVESSLNAHFDTLSCDRGCLDESSCCELLPCCCRESLQRLKGMQAAWRPIAFYSHASQTSRWSSVGLKRE
jgi:hypothetical protein